MPYIDRINAVHIGSTNPSQMSGLDKINAAIDNESMKIALCKLKLSVR
jgi:hypothetical protein